MTSKENMLKTIFRQNPQWVPNGMESTLTIGPPVIERPDLAGFDAWGVEYELDVEVEGGTYPKKDGHSIKDFSNWRNEIQIPNVDELDWDSMVKKYDLYNIDRENIILMGFVEFGIFERIYMLLGMENALIYFLTDQDEMLELAKVIANYKITLIKKFQSMANLDMIWYGDDWGTQRKLFLPPYIWRKIIKSQTKRIYDCMKELNIIINQHSCGMIEEIFEDIVEMGADIYNPCQPCNNLAIMKLNYGDSITFCGGIDSQFVLDRKTVTIYEVRAEVRTRIDEMGKNGGYIAAPSHRVKFREDVILAMNDEIKKYGKNNNHKKY